MQVPSFLCDDDNLHNWIIVSRTLINPRVSGYRKVMTTGRLKCRSVLDAAALRLKRAVPIFTKFPVETVLWVYQ